jgi:hypothetical protein
MYPGNVSRSFSYHASLTGPDDGVRVDKMLKQHEHPEFLNEPDAAEFGPALFFLNISFSPQIPLHPYFIENHLPSQTFEVTHNNNS